MSRAPISQLVPPSALCRTLLARNHSAYSAAIRICGQLKLSNLKLPLHKQMDCHTATVLWIALPQPPTPSALDPHDFRSNIGITIFSSQRSTSSSLLTEVEEDRDSPQGRDLQDGVGLERACRGLEYTAGPTLVMAMQRA